MNMIKRSFPLIVMVILLQGCASSIKRVDQSTIIFLSINSDPQGAQIYIGSTPDQMRFYGTTPFRRSHIGVYPYWKEMYFQFKKEGYHDSEIIHEEQLPVDRDRKVSATLKPIAQQKISPAPEPKNDQKSKRFKTGTAFFINQQGNIVSNYHVVQACANIEVRNVFFKAKAKLLYTDNINDLAVLIVDTIPPSSVGYFRSGKELRVGDDIITIGYPLGSILGESVKVTKGNISSLTGIANDSSILQISASIQPGSSGGPLLDNSGNIVGIVSSKLSELAMLKATGSLPQNINFAIKSQAVQLFLNTHKIMYSLQQSDKNYETADIVEKAQEFTLQIQCSE